VRASRAADQNWADSVAGDMERHYSPGRTWEALARTALPLLETGDVLDIASGDGVLAELLAPHAKQYICVDTSARVVAAASERLRRLPNVEVREGDMHALPFADASFDLVVLMHALTYASKPAQAVTEAARVLRPGGRVLLCSLAPKRPACCARAAGCCCAAWPGTNTARRWRPMATSTWVSATRSCAASSTRPACRSAAWKR